LRGDPDEGCVLFGVVENGKRVVARPWAGLEMGGDISEVPFSKEV
jgi:hypothetical protein